MVQNNYYLTMILKTIITICTAVLCWRSKKDGKKMNVQENSCRSVAVQGAMLWQSREQWMVFHQVYSCSVSDLTFIYYLSP